MNKTSLPPVYVTLSDSETFVGVDTKCVGKVDTYNTFFSKMISKLFGWSMKVRFDEEICYVEKKSYLELVNNLGFKNITLKNIKKYRNFSSIARAIDLTKHDKLMRNEIDSETKDKLLGKLAKAISQGNQKEAIKMIGKGAPLDREFYERTAVDIINVNFNNNPMLLLHPKQDFDKEKFGISLKEDSSSLDTEENLTLLVHSGTPILLADRHNLQDVVKELIRFGAQTEGIVGKEYLYKREIAALTKVPHKLVALQLNTKGVQLSEKQAEMKVIRYLEGRSPQAQTWQFPCRPNQKSTV